MTAASPNVVLLAGGTGGARLAPALCRLDPAPGLSVVANVGDDVEWFGLRICPDLDAITYALAGLWDADRGWGQRDETFTVAGALRTFGTAQWFNVGDRDLALHLFRHGLLSEGTTLTRAAAAILDSLGVQGIALLPASDALPGTQIQTRGGKVVTFQEWYVRDRAEDEVEAVILPTAEPAPDVLTALKAADAVIIGPSNPITSIAPILALPGVRDAVRRVPLRIAVTPIVLGVPPANSGIQHHTDARTRVLRSIGLKDTPGDIATIYSDLVQCFVIDQSDREFTQQVADTGLVPALCDTLDPDALARALNELIIAPRASG